MLPALAHVDQLAARHPGAVGDGDVTRAQAALDDASALIRAAAGKTWVDADNALDDVPHIVVTICCRAALRAFSNPAGVTQQTSGPFSESYANGSTDVYLTAGERAQVRAAAGKSPLTTQGTTRGPLETRGCIGYPREGVADEYVDVSPPGQPLPFG